MKTLNYVHYIIAIIAINVDYGFNFSRLQYTSVNLTLSTSTQSLVAFLCCGIAVLSFITETLLFSVPSSQITLIS